MILVFGGDGQLGRELVDAAGLRKCPLMAVSHRDVDIADPTSIERVIGQYRPSFVVNAAAYTDVERAEVEVDKAFKSNSEGPRGLATLCAERNIPLIHISTDYVFDGRKHEPYCEADHVCPLGVYGRSKAAGETAIMAETDHYAIIRTSWLFSKYGRNFLKAMLALSRQHDELRVVDDQYGCPTSARTLASAVLNIAPRLSADKSLSGIYHVAGTPATSWHDFARHIVSVQSASTGRHPTVTAVSSADYGAVAPRPMNSALDCTKARRVFGIEGSSWQSEARDIVNDLLSTEILRTDHVA